MEYHVPTEDLNAYVADTLINTHTVELIEMHIAKCARCANALGAAVRTALDAQLAKLEEGQRAVDALRKKVNKALGYEIN